MYQLRIDKKEPLPVHLQLLEQFKVQIESGSWKPGSKLPTVRALAAKLGINYNTVRAVYQELECSRYVVTEQGRGTFVAQAIAGLTVGNYENIVELVDDALMRAYASGISLDVFARTAYTRAKLYSPPARNTRILFAECNPADLDYFASSIERVSGARPVTYMLDELRNYNDGFFMQFDLIATTLSHMLELQELVGLRRSDLGLKIEPSYVHVLMKIAHLPKGTPVGFLCATRERAEQMKQAVLGAGVVHIHPMTGGINRSEEIEEVFEAAEHVFVSRHGLSLHQEQWPGDRVVQEYVTDLDPLALRLLRQELLRVRSADVSAEEGR